jgi:hypothetical protein
MTFYEEMQGVASDLLGEFRQGVVILTKTVTAPGPNDWTPGTETSTDYPLDAVVRAVEDKYVDGTTVLTTDRQVTCSVLAVEIEPGDRLAIDGKAVTLVKVMRIPAAGMAVAWKMIVRG